MKLRELFDDYDINTAFNITLVENGIRRGFMPHGINIIEGRRMIKIYDLNNIKTIERGNTFVFVSKKEEDDEPNITNYLGYQCDDYEFFKFPLIVKYVVFYRYNEETKQNLFIQRCKLGTDLNNFKERLIEMQLLADKIKDIINRKIIIKLEIEFDFMWRQFQISLERGEAFHIIHPYEDMFYG